ncbi:MAG: hypothetical protein WCP24_03050 [bacterium]
MNNYTLKIVVKSFFIFIITLIIFTAIGFYVSLLGISDSPVSLIQNLFSVIKLALIPSTFFFLLAIIFGFVKEYNKTKNH